jgi:molybdate transport system permease protein
VDWQALILSLKLSAWTLVLLLPIGLLTGRLIAWRRFRGHTLLQALLALPLVLPPTVLGFYLLLAFSGDGALGSVYQSLAGKTLAFSFEGLLIASILFNIPFAVQPLQRAYESIPADVRDAAACCGMSAWEQFRVVELPLIWPGLLGAAVLVFAHTLGEFGVVLMVGGNIPGETRTVAISIYDSVQAFDNRSAAIMSGVLLLVSLVAIALVFAVGNRQQRHFHAQS